MQKPDPNLFPLEPGVYLFKDAAGHILYVGKARLLRRRLASYFKESSALSPKTRLLLQAAERVDILRTGTEKEALLLEASLIKKHRPRYNILLRDDKEYLLFRVGMEHAYPRVEVVRRNMRKGKDRQARYFGPFSSAQAARDTLKLIGKHFPLRRCRDISFATRTRPCLYHDMGQCLAPCVLPVPRENYLALLDQVVLLLSGKSRELIAGLTLDMAKAAEEMRYEDAAVLRDQIQAVERTLERQSVVLDERRTLDLIGVAQLPEGLALGVVFVRDGLLLDGRNFFWPGLAVEDTPELLVGFLAQFYLDRRGLGESIPPRIVVPWLPEVLPESSGGGPDDGAAMERSAGDDSPEENPASVFSLPALEAALAEIREGPVQLSRPRGADEDNLLLMAVSNAREAVKNANSPSLPELLARRLHSARPIRRIEAVDISHTGGKKVRAGSLLFEDGRPVSGAARDRALDGELAAAGAEAGDDYAALAAWARRRAKSDAPWPDLVLVDGGKGQLAAVQRAFKEAGIVTGPGPDDAFLLASIAKARQEDGQADRRAGNVSDRIFLPGRSNPAAFPPGSAELLFLQRIRNEVHDFAIGRHRRARAAATLAGELTRLPGVGQELARRLYIRFGSLADMAKAGETGLAEVPGIGARRAKAIAARLAVLVASEPDSAR